MLETVGTLNLKIAQLERRLQLLQQQQRLSQVYPGHHAKLVQEDDQVRRQLQQLRQRRQSLASFFPK
jgi:coproporphyrinogen III oxidase-like Fe-S oxidoreductase